MPASSAPDPREVVEALSRAGLREVGASRLDRSLYSSDASLYRVEPLAVARPRHTDEVVAALDACRSLGIPVTMRGAGTSIAGNAVGPGVVLDTSRHLRRVLEIDADAGTAVVEPGVVQAALQRRVLPLGWRFGPDPSTHDRATIGGMVGNNACGSRALGYGRTSDNVLGLDVVTGAGERLLVGALPGALPGARSLVSEGPAAMTTGHSDAGATSAVPGEALGRLQGIVAADLGTVRTEFGRFSRQVSGYSMEHLLPEHGFDVARFLVGSEGTLATMLRVKVRLVRDPAATTLVALGYPSMADAADAVPGILAHHPVACEGLDRRIVDVVRNRRGPGSVPGMPRGAGWLLVEVVGDSPAQAAASAAGVVRGAGALDARVVADPGQAAALWRIRMDGAGLSSRTPSGAPAHSGWEDAAVPPQRLGAYLREFDALLDSHRLTGVPYGHLGDGCLHIRIDFPFDEPGGIEVFRAFLHEAATLAAAHGGSMSGEHGDGRARSELLPLMYSPDALSLFDRVKETFDPGRLLNPGVIVDPDPATAAIRAAAAGRLTRAERPSLVRALRDDRGDLSMAVHRCTGVGKCRSQEPGPAVMCPSYRATLEEKDSTRARARVLQDVVAGRFGPDGWRDQAVHDVLDLCLACKGCASDCPTGVDMAAYKSEALHQRYRHRLRPRAHYALGWLPRWTRLAARMPGAVRTLNRLLGTPSVHRLATWSAGVDPRRELPRLAPQTFRAWFGHRAAAHGNGTEVVLFVDTFTDAFSPEVGRAGVAVLEAAGYRVLVTEKPVCCGLTWISTGQLDRAAREARATVRALLPHVRSGRRVVGLEPSCLAVLRDEAAELTAGDAVAAAEADEVASSAHTLAELLAATPGWAPPDLGGVTGVAQPHCHQHAVLGWDADAALLASAGASIEAVGGCCGLAGNFGVEAGHHDLSVAVAGLALLPAIERAAVAVGAEAVVLADGFSCRTQLAALAGRRGEHLAELLVRHTPELAARHTPEGGPSPRVDPATPRWPRLPA